MFSVLLASIASFICFADAQHLFDHNLAYSSPFANAPHVSTTCTSFLSSIMFTRTL